MLAGALLLAALTGWGQSAPTAELDEIRARAGKSDPEALNTLGNIYTNGLLGEKRDFAEALKWYRSAGDKGFAAAQFNLGLAYELGRGVPADERQAFKYYLMAAEQGYAAAQFNVGNMYSTGRGVAQDLFEANLWYKQAAEKGIVEALLNLGVAYEAGRGVKKDELQAARWYKQAADRGLPSAQYNLGVLFEDGRGVAKNEITAAGLYQSAAEQGYPPAQNNFGVMLADGRGGLAKDPVQAYVWLNLAVENGSTPAARDFVAKALTPDQLAAATRLLAERRSGKAPPAAPAGAAVPVAAPENSATASRMAELTAALEKARQANTQFAETNQRLELEKARLEQELTQGSESGKLIEQLREQSQRLAGQVQTLIADKEAAEREAKVFAAQFKDVADELARRKTAGPVTAASAMDATKQQGEITALRIKLGEVTNSLSQLQQERDTPAAAESGKYPVVEGDKSAIIANLQRDNARLNDEVKRSTRELLSLNSQLRMLRNQAGKPATSGTADNTASAEVRAESQRVASNNDRLQGQRDSAVNDAETLLAQLKDARSEITRLNADLGQLRAARQSSDAASDQLGQLTSRIRDLEAQLKQTQASPPAPDNSQALAQLQQQVKALQGEKADLEKWSQTLEKNINEKSAAIKTSDANGIDLSQKLAEAQKQLDDATAARGAQEQLAQKLAQENRTLTDHVTRAEEALAAQAARKPDTTQLDQLSKRLTESQERAENLSQKVAQAQKQLDDATAARGTQEQLAQKLTQENRTLTDRTTRAEQALAAQAGQKPDTTQLDQLNQKLAEAQQRADKLTQDNNSLAEKVTDEHRSFIAAQTRVAGLERDMREAQQAKSSDTAGLDDLKKQLAEAGSALEKSGATVAELTAANDKLEKDLAEDRRILASMEALRLELARAQREAGQVTALREENSRLLKAADEAAALRSKNDQLARDNAQLTGSLNGSHRELDQAQGRVAELEKQLEGARTIHPRDGDDTKKLQTELAEASQSTEKLNATVAELTAANDKLEKDLDSARKSTEAALTAQSQAASAAQPDAYKMEISTLQARVKELEGQMEEDRNNSAKEVGTLAAQLARTRETNKSLTEANRALLNAKQSDTPTVDKDQFDQLQAKVRDLSAVGEELKRQNQKLTDDGQRLATERETFKQQLEESRKVATTVPGLTDEKSALQERLEAVGAQLVKAQQEIDALQKDNADATSQTVAVKQEADKALADLAALQGRTADAEKAAEVHNTSVAELTEANGKLETERNDLRKQVTVLRTDNTRLSQTAGSLEQLKADSDRSAQQNIEALTAQLAQTRRDLQSARDANSRLVEGNVSQERANAAALAQLRNENSALVARLTQAQGTLDQIAATARLGTPASTIASGGAVPTRPVTPPAATVEVRFHTVAEGDSLSRISMRYYGTPNRWQEIYNANRDVLQGSAVLRIGMQLRIP